MMMEATMEKLEMAFERGTHANRQDFNVITTPAPSNFFYNPHPQVITKNMESVAFEGPDRTKRILGSFPGSVRVSLFFFYWGEKDDDTR